MEDFVAVILLTVLAGVATADTTSLGDIGVLAARLAIFGVAVLTIGALLAPRLMHYIARFESEEMVLITTLTLCFGLALAAHQLGLSAAAGAFLIGMILGDTELSEQISRLMNPLRDMFAALFFVSLGMLMDVLSIGDYLVPAMVIAGVFIVGKVLADTLGTLLAGQDGRTALEVGTGMPQLGEFSLAMAKTGVDHGSVSAYFSPALTLATAITALIYPFIFRSPLAVANFIARTSPRLAAAVQRGAVRLADILQAKFRAGVPAGRRSYSRNAANNAERRDSCGFHRPRHHRAGLPATGFAVDRHKRRAGNPVAGWSPRCRVHSGGRGNLA